MNYMTGGFTHLDADTIAAIDAREPAPTRIARNSMEAAVWTLRDYSTDRVYITGMRELLIENGIFDFLELDKPIRKNRGRAPCMADLQRYYRDPNRTVRQLARRDADREEPKWIRPRN